MIKWHVHADPVDHRRGRLEGPDGFSVPVALGKGGVKPEREKREGDGASPLGSFGFLRVFFRPDRVKQPIVTLPSQGLSPDMGWCDDPDHAFYNKQVRLPFGPSHEKLWREDHLYDLVVVISHNDDPVVPGLGSAIFVHCAHIDFRPTEGCVALQKSDLLRFVRLIRPDDQLVIALE